MRLTARESLLQPDVATGSILTGNFPDHHTALLLGFTIRQIVCLAALIRLSNGTDVLFPEHCPG